MFLLGWVITRPLIIARAADGLSLRFIHIIIHSRMLTSFILLFDNTFPCIGHHGGVGNSLNLPVLDLLFRAKLMIRGRGNSLQPASKTLFSIGFKLIA